MPTDWAMTQNNLGIVLASLGERESGTARLDEAVAAFRAALEVYTRADMPTDWAMTQNNLGTVLQSLGEREGGHGAAGRGRRRLPRRAGGQNPRRHADRLGRDPEQPRHRAQTLGERESGTARLEEAVAAYRAALEVSTRDAMPTDWAMTQNNLGTVLQSLGERESGTARLEEAVAAYRAALEVRTRADMPTDWAMTQNNLGTVLQSLGERESGTRRGWRGRRRLPRGAGGQNPRRHADRLGRDPEQPRQGAA